jgi:hypothetical protein
MYHNARNEQCKRTYTIASRGLFLPGKLGKLFLAKVGAHCY